MLATATTPPLSRRAPGPIALLAPPRASPASECVLALDTSLRAHTVSLAHPVVACWCMAAQGELWEATQVRPRGTLTTTSRARPGADPCRTSARWQRAGTELPLEQHDAFAHFLATIPAGSGGLGATHALWLPGLSQRATLEMALQAGEGLERGR
jgi:hypothetical protein